jgi:glycosyltransferase involved in cell wall biosynthesis
MLATSFPKYHGDTTAPFIAEIAAGVVAHGVVVRLLLPHHREFRHETIERGVELRTFRYAPHPSWALWGYAEALQADVGLRRRALYVTPFALIASTWSLWRQAREFHPDVIHGHWVLPNGLPAMIVAWLCKVPLVISMHGSDVAMAERTSLYRRIAGWIFGQTRFATVCSGDLHQRALALGADPATTITLPYGVAASEFRPDMYDRSWIAQRFGIAATAPLVVAVGRFVTKKGFHHLLRTLPVLRASNPQVRLLLAGYGDLHDEYVAIIDALGVADMVVMPGQLLRDEVARVIASADVYCVPSVHDELGNVDGLPNALLEGMAAGRAIVASAVAGIPDVITDGVQGLLVPEGDEPRLAQAIVSILSNRAYADRLGMAARAQVSDALTWSRVTARLVAGYAEVCKK